MVVLAALIRFKYKTTVYDRTIMAVSASGWKGHWRFSTRGNPLRQKPRIWLVAWQRVLA
jgi:hypothetical protein